MKLKLVLCLATALLAPLALTACNEEGVGGFVAGAKHMRPLRPEIIKLMEDKGMRKEDPILIRTFKEDNTLEVWKRDKTGKFAFLKSYQMCAWGGTLGPKIKEGDKQSPEGFYTVTPSRMNPNSQFFLAFDIGYPNAFDRSFGRTGAAVMVHGNCTASAGCFVMTDQQVEEIYGLAREALNGGQPSFQVQAYPFRLTATNLAKHRRSPHLAFWRNIKEGYDHFELTRLEPKVDVCNHKYVFNAQATGTDSTTFNPSGACPAYAMPESIASLVKAKESADEAEFKTVVAELDSKEKAAADAELAAKMEAAKPKQPNMIASILGVKPTEPAQTGSTTVVTAGATPINVPVPKASPRGPAPGQMLAVASADQTPKSDPGLLQNFFGFAPTSDATASTTPVVPPPATALPATPVPAAAKPTVTATAKPVPGAPLPASKPAPAGTVLPLDPAEAKAPPAEKAGWWQKLNPFGG